MVFKPKGLVTILIIASALTRYRLQIGGVHIPLDTALVPSCLVSVFMHGYGRIFFRQIQRPEIKLLIAYLILNFASSWTFSPNRVASLNICIWLTLNLTVVALALAIFENDKDGLFRRMFISAFIVVASGVTGWLFAVTTGNFLAAISDPSEGIRATGVSWEPNILGGSAAIWALVLLTQPRKVNKVQWLFLVLAGAAITLSSTRAAFVALGVGLVIFMLRMGHRIFRLVPVLMAGFAVLALLQAAFPETLLNVTRKFRDLRFTNQNSLYRYNSWTTAIHEMRGIDWMIGKGTNSFGQRHFDPTHPGLHLPYYLGNLPLATLYDVGLIGAFTLLVVAKILIVRKGSDRDVIRRVATFVTFLLLSIGTSPFYFAFYWLFIALALAEFRLGASPPRELITGELGNAGFASRDKDTLGLIGGGTHQKKFQKSLNNSKNPQSKL